MRGKIRATYRATRVRAGKTQRFNVNPHRLAAANSAERRACKTLGPPRSTQHYAGRRREIDAGLVRAMRRIAVRPESGHQSPPAATPGAKQQRGAEAWSAANQPCLERRFCVRPDRKRRTPQIAANPRRRHAGVPVAGSGKIDHGPRGHHHVGKTGRRAWSPEYLRSDHGPEFIAEAVKVWIAKIGFKTLYIEPGAPWQNAYSESFNARFRDEFLNVEIFGSLLEAKVLGKEHRDQDNHQRPHSSLGEQTPAEFAQRCFASLRATPSTTQNIATNPNQPTNLS